MICPLCSREITSLTGPYKVYQPNIHGKDEGGEAETCGQCFVLISILDTMKRLLEVLERGRLR